METNPQLSLAASQALTSQEAKAFYSELKSEGYSLLISKKQYAEILGCSLSSIDKSIQLGHGLPNYKKLGTAKNAKVMFSLLDVANYLATQTVKTAQYEKPTNNTINNQNTRK